LVGCIPPLLKEGAMQLHWLCTVLEQLRSHLKPVLEVAHGIYRWLDERTIFA
jgi:hypothetical protein